jgi:D-alanyl-D-alanine carboxypeptidase (penicillin-binding protein 5/6)
MKKLVLFLLLVIVPLKTYALTDTAKSTIAMDMDSGRILYEKNANEQRLIASITKIMTATVAIENADLNKEITIGEEVLKMYGSNIYVELGERMTLKNLLYGLLLRSGNDAAVVIANNVAKDEESFVEMMNKKAKDIGMNDSVFSNATGLDEEDAGNRSSAYDMALLMSYCSQNPIFNDIVMKQTYKREDAGGTWHNKNRLLEEYEYCVGGKTGFTKKARRTLVTRAIKNDVSLVIVTLNCGNDFEFHKAKYEECFGKYQNMLVLPKGIYQYHGHSFLIDEDLYYCGQETSKASLQGDNDSLKVYVSQNQIYEVKREMGVQTILRYWFILLGEFVNG